MQSHKTLVVCCQFPRNASVIRHFHGYMWWTLSLHESVLSVSREDVIKSGSDVQIHRLNIDVAEAWIRTWVTGHVFVVIVIMC